MAGSEFFRSGVRAAFVGVSALVMATAVWAQAPRCEPGKVAEN